MNTENQIMQFRNFINQKKREINTQKEYTVVD